MSRKVALHSILNLHFRRSLNTLYINLSTSTTGLLLEMGKKRKRGGNGQNNQMNYAKQNHTLSFHVETYPDPEKSNQSRNSNNRQGKNKKSQLLKVPTRINLVVLGTGGPGTSQSLLLTTEYSKYLFNCGEGSQRLASMSKWLRKAAFARLAGVDNIFITHKSWENTGGLLGMSMTLEVQKNPGSRDKNIQSQSSTVPQITVHGPPDVEKIALMAKKFSIGSNLNIVRGVGVYEDTYVTITPVIFNNKLASSINNIQDATESQPAKRQRKSSQGIITDVAYCYIVQAKPPLPKINVEKCLKAGIQIGPLVGMLKRGQSVVLNDGTVVKPEQVTDLPATDSRPFLIVECPSEEFLPSLVACPQLKGYTKGQDNKESFSVIVHMTPKDVYECEDYQAWMKSFHVSTDHLVLNRNAIPADLTRVREHQARLNLVSSEIFPILPPIEMSDTENIEFVNLNQEGRDQQEDQVALMTPELTQILLRKKGQVAMAFSGLVYVCRGKLPGFHKETDEFNLTQLQQDFLSKSEVKDELDKLALLIATKSSECIHDDEADDVECTKYPRVVFLGTGSSEPNRMRAQSCIVVHLSKRNVIMLDCGEDSYGQLYRFYGPSKIKSVLRHLQAIFISHLHGDHHLGLITILKERKKACDLRSKTYSPVMVMAPVQIKRWFKFYHTELEDMTPLLRFVRLQTLANDFNDVMKLQVASHEEVLQELALLELTPVPVEHCNNAFGVSFRHSSGFKLVYSGDTMPCEALVKAGEKCDLLIHEATHEDSLSVQAKFSKHSTFSQAIDVGKRMEAKHIILTHFSQRYAHMVPLSNVDLPSNVGIAFDNMQVDPKSMQHLPKLIPALTALFYDELKKPELKTLRRNKVQSEPNETSMESL